MCVPTTPNTPCCATFNPSGIDEEAPLPSPPAPCVAVAPPQLDIQSSLGEMQIVPEPLPCLNLWNCKARLAVGQRCKEEEAPEHHNYDNSSGNPTSHLAGCSDTFADRSRASPAVAFDGRGIGLLWFDAKDKLNEGTGDQTGG